MVDINKLHFSNFFNVFENPEEDMLPGELAFNKDYRMVYKDDSGDVHLLPSIYDYINIYDPQGIKITQIIKDSKVGVGVEGDFSDKVTIALPHSFKIFASDISERQILVHYDKNDVVKDTLILPEFFCKLEDAVDVLDVNTGIMREAVNKIRINDQPQRTELLNNAIFKLAKLSTDVVATSGNHPITIEANKDNVEYRGHIYIGSDNYLYLIEDVSTTELELPLYVLNKRIQPIDVRVPTKYLLFEKGDKFSLKTYRSFAGEATDITHKLIGDDESYSITDIVRSERVAFNRVSYENLTISSDGKRVVGLDGASYYDIVVITNENNVHPTLEYAILDISDGFFNYIYRIMKYISDNSGGLNALSMGRSTGRKYLFEYTFTAEQDDISSFSLPEEYFNPENGDREMLVLKGVMLEKLVDYNMAKGSRRVDLNFSINQGESIHAYIFKFVEYGDEASLISGLQNIINEVEHRSKEYTNLKVSEVTAESIGAETPQGAQDKVDEHAFRDDNPHNLTAEQIGALTTDGRMAMQAPLTLHGNPTGALHAIPKQYVDSIIQGVDPNKVKRPVIVATTVHTDTSGFPTVDGVSLVDGDRVLVWKQDNPAENGIYVVQEGEWERSDDFDDSSKVTSGVYVYVQSGDVHGGNGYVLFTEDPIDLDVTELEFIQFSGIGKMIAGNGLELNGNVMSIDNTVETKSSSQDRINNLAGSGRTDETVKGNYDLIQQLIQRVKNHEEDFDNPHTIKSEHVTIIDPISLNEKGTLYPLGITCFSIPPGEPIPTTSGDSIAYNINLGGGQFTQYVFDNYDMYYRGWTEYNSSWTNWNSIVTSDNNRWSGAFPITLQNGWWGNLYIRVHSLLGLVWVYGHVMPSNNRAHGTTIAIVPALFRPEYSVPFVVQQEVSNNAHIGFTIRPSGNIILTAPSNVNYGEECSINLVYKA